MTTPTPEERENEITVPSETYRTGEEWASYFIAQGYANSKSMDSVMHHLARVINVALETERDVLDTSHKAELSRREQEHQEELRGSILQTNEDRAFSLDYVKKKDHYVILGGVERRHAEEIRKAKEVIEWLASDVTCDCGHGKSCPYRAVTAYQDDEGTNWVMCAHCITHCSGLPPYERFKNIVQQCEPERDWCNCRAPSTPPDPAA